MKLIGKWAKELWVECGDHVRVIGTFSKANGFHLILDGEQVGEARADFIIVEPSILIPTTQIVKASKCRRNAYLGHMYKGLNGDLNYAQVLGNIVHEIF